MKRFFVLVLTLLSVVALFSSCQTQSGGLCQSQISLLGAVEETQYDDDGNLISLTPAQQDRYLRRFEHPDIIAKDEIGRTIFATFIGG